LENLLEKNSVIISCSLVGVDIIALAAYVHICCKLNRLLPYLTPIMVKT
jgi:hypothetical protein